MSNNAMNLLRKINCSMMRVMVLVLPSCKDVSALVSQSLDRELPLAKRVSVRIHLAMCSMCRRYERQLGLLREGARRYAKTVDDTCEPQLSPEASERMKKSLKYSGAGSSPSSES